jgi:mRNA-degrading endonuclease toxin of MazEF toxin-antitoxin module
VKRGEIWTVSRLGHERKVIVVGAEGVTARESTVLVVPISDVKPPSLVEPTVSDIEGAALGVAQILFVGQVGKASMKDRAGELTPASVEIVDMSLRAALAL